MPSCLGTREYYLSANTKQNIPFVERIAAVAQEKNTQHVMVGRFLYSIKDNKVVNGRNAHYACSDPLFQL